MTILGAIAAFLDTAGRESDKTRQSYETALNHFMAFLGDDRDVAELTLTDARNFAGWLTRYRNPQTGYPLSPTSRSLYILAVSLFFRRLILDRDIEDTWQDYVNYRDELKLKRNGAPLEKKLPPDDLITAMLAVVDQEPEIDKSISPGDQVRARLLWLRNRAIVHTLYSSGMRVGELVRLQRGDLRPDKQGTWVRGKGDKERFVRLSADAWEAVRDYLLERDAGKEEGLPGLPVFARHNRQAGKRILPISTRLVERVISDIAEQTGLGEKFNMHPHALRHYFATRFLRGTGDLALTQDVLGHADPSTTRVYAETSEEAYIKAHKEIFNDQ